MKNEQSTNKQSKSERSKSEQSKSEQSKSEQSKYKITYRRDSAAMSNYSCVTSCLLVAG